MQNEGTLKAATRWLLGTNGDTESTSHDCCVDGCGERMAVAVAGDESSTTGMCIHHAIAWSESTLCRDYVQHNSSVAATALSTWVRASGEGHSGPTVYVPSYRSL